METESRYQVLFTKYDQTPSTVVSEQTIGHEILALTPDPSNATNLEKAELFAFQFVENYRNIGGAGIAFFKPHRSRSLPDGTEQVYPDIREVTTEMMDYWQYRAEISKHPVIKARYAGLVYEFGQQVRGQKTVHAISRMFARALMESVNEELINVFLYKVGKLQKAISVASLLNDSDLMEEIKNSILLLESSVPITETKNFWSFSFDLLLTGRKKIISEAEENTLIDRLQQRFIYFLTSDAEAAFEAAIRLCSYYHAKKERDKVFDVLEQLEGALRKTFEDQPVFQKVRTLERLHMLYGQYGQSKKVGQLLVEIRTISREADREMKSVSGSATVSQSDIDDMVNKILNFEGHQLFITLAVQSSLNLETIKSAVEMSVQQNGFYSALSKDLLDAKGRKIGVIPPYREGALPYMIRQAEFFIKYNAMFFRMIINEGIKRDLVTSPELMKYIRLSNAFEKPNLSIVERAIDYYLTGDYVAFISVIIPQIEEAVRNLLEKEGGNILVKKEDMYMLKNLDQLLNDPIVVTKLSEPNCFHFKTLLSERTGMNLRNDLAHGYMPPDKFNEQNADALLAALLIFVLQSI